jgi:hypothetical protein
MGLHRLQQSQHFRREQRRCHYRSRIGIAPERRANRRAADNRRYGKDIAVSRFQGSYRLFYDRFGQADMRQPLIGTQRNQIELLAQISSASRPYSCGLRSRKKPMEARCARAASRSKLATSKPVSLSSRSQTTSPHSLVMKLVP